jgi:hypothetical protein
MQVALNNTVTRNLFLPIYRIIGTMRTEEEHDGLS